MSRNFQGQIRSNTIAPTFIETPLTHPFFEHAQFKASVLAKIKLGRSGQVEDILGAIIYLASDAAAIVTGTSLLVDGGWTADRNDVCRSQATFFDRRATVLTGPHRVVQLDC